MIPGLMLRVRLHGMYIHARVLAFCIPAQPKREFWEPITTAWSDKGEKKTYTEIFEGRIDLRSRECLTKRTSVVEWSLPAVAFVFVGRN